MMAQFSAFNRELVLDAIDRTGDEDRLGSFGYLGYLPKETALQWKRAKDDAKA